MKKNTIPALAIIILNLVCFHLSSRVNELERRVDDLMEITKSNTDLIERNVGINKSQTIILEKITK